MYPNEIELINTRIEIGRGSSGVVLEGDFGKLLSGHRLLRVALKFIYESMETINENKNKSKNKRKIFAEMSMLKAFQHNNIVRAIGYCIFPEGNDHEFKICMIYEMMAGGDLKSCLQNNEIKEQLDWKNSYISYF